MAEEVWFEMKYNIMSISDDRIIKKREIQQVMQNADIGRVHIPAIDGNTQMLEKELKRRNIVPKRTLRRGELGVWLSNLNVLDFSKRSRHPVLNFEDDAIVLPSIRDITYQMFKEIRRFDFFALYPPPNQYQDISYMVNYDERGMPYSVTNPADKYDFEVGSYIFARCYQGYGAVANVYTPYGAEKILRLVEKEGIDDPMDCWLFQKAHAGKLDAYTVKPGLSPIDYDWGNDVTQVHNTGDYHAV